MSSSGEYESEVESDLPGTQVQAQGQRRQSRRAVPPLLPAEGGEPPVPPAALTGGDSSTVPAQPSATTPGGTGGVRGALQQAFGNAARTSTGVGSSSGAGAAEVVPATTTGTSVTVTTTEATSIGGGPGGGSTNPDPQIKIEPGLQTPHSGVQPTANVQQTSGGTGPTTGTVGTQSQQTSQVPSQGGDGHSQQQQQYTAASTQGGVVAGRAASQGQPASFNLLKQQGIGHQQLYIEFLQQELATAYQLQQSTLQQQAGQSLSTVPTSSAPTSTTPTGTAPTSTAPTGTAPNWAPTSQSQAPTVSQPAGSQTQRPVSPKPEPETQNWFATSGSGQQYGTQQTYLPSGYNWQPKNESLEGRAGAQGHGGRPQPTLQAPKAPTPMTAIASYGGYSMPDYGAAHRFGIGDPFYQPYASENSAHPLHKGPGPDYSAYPKAESIASVVPVSKEQKSTQFEFGLPPSVKNAVRMIQPFYSEGATVEKARSFWDAFERATVGLADAVRLSAFRVLLKGKTGEDWWMYSRIDDFDTLRTRFYNQFICQTPLQMIERLKNAKRSKGMSAEVWGDVISNLCDAAQVVDPHMRYQYFLAGLRNKEWKTALQTTMVNDIPRAVTTLLYKNRHLPAEDKAEFEGEVTKKPTTEEGMMQQMLGLMRQTQNLLVTQNQLMARSPRSPRNRVSDTQPPFIAATYEDQTLNISAVAENAPNVAGGNRRMGPDQYTREGLSVCGRCHFLGCSRETCRYNNMTCSNCRVRGHVAFECVQPRQSNNGGNRGQQSNGGQQLGSSGNNRKNGGSGSQQRGGRCFLCDDPNHRVPQCPLRQRVRQLAASGAAGASPEQGQVPTQH